MKVAMGMKLQDGAFGGGNQFAKQLVVFLQGRGIQVCFDLKDNDIDIILMTDPREYLGIVNFGPKAISNYLQKNPRAIIVHRVNECDERKDTKHMNDQIVMGNAVADHTIYVSGWLKGLYDKYNLNLKSHSVIINGADENIYQWSAKKLPEGKVRFVTHHFSANFMKGWDVYLELDRLISLDRWKNRLEFHYIGNYPKNLNTQNTIFHEPSHGVGLAKELSKNHIYITASLNEPGSNHQLEGALCGLPVIFLASGGIPETCQGFGVEIKTKNELEQAIEKLLANYEEIQNKLNEFPHSGTKMCQQYLACFESLIGRREELISKRKSFSWYDRVLLQGKSRYFQILDRLGHH